MHFFRYISEGLFFCAHSHWEKAASELDIHNCKMNILPPVNGIERSAASSHRPAHPCIVSKESFSIAGLAKSTTQAGHSSAAVTSTGEEERTQSYEKVSEDFLPDGSKKIARSATKIGMASRSPNGVPAGVPQE